MSSLAVELRKSDGNCFDDLITTVDGYYGRGIEMMYADSLRFGMREPDADQPLTLGQRMQVDFATFFRTLERYHGYQLRLHNNMQAEEAYAYVCDQVARGNPVALYLDSYNIPWDAKFLSVHIVQHVFLVTGFNAASGDLRCADPYYGHREQTLPRQHFLDGYSRIITFEPAAESSVPDAASVLDGLQTSLRQYAAEHEVTRHLRAFAEAVPGIDFEAEKGGFASFGESLLFMKMNRLLYARVQYGRILHYLSQRYGMTRLDPLRDEMREVADRWAMVRGLLVKMHLLSRSNALRSVASNAVEKILENAEREAALVDRLIEAFADPMTGAKVAGGIVVPLGNRVADEDSDIRNVYPLDIRAWCNNRGVLTTEGTGNFDTLDCCYDRAGAPASGILETDGMRFLFPALQHDDPDNISCLGQIVTVEQPDTAAKGIMILGSCEHGGYQDSLTIEFADGTTESVTFAFADWWSTLTIAKEIPVWRTGVVRPNHDGFAGTVHLYACKIPFRAAQPVRRIHLPYLPNIHLFGLSLWE